MEKALQEAHSLIYYEYNCSISVFTSARYSTYSDYISSAKAFENVATG